MNQAAQVAASLPPEARQAPPEVKAGLTPTRAHARSGGRSKRRRRSRWVEDTDYGKMVARMVDAYGRRLEKADAEDLPQLAALSGHVEAVLNDAIGAMRRRGVTWTEIGEAFGITRQAAQQRWGNTAAAKKKATVRS